MSEGNIVRKQSLESTVSSVRPFKSYEIPKRFHKDYDLKTRYFVSADELRQIGISSDMLSKKVVPGIKYMPEVQDLRKYQVSYRIMAYVDRLAAEVADDFFT